MTLEQSVLLLALALAGAYALPRLLPAFLRHKMTPERLL